MSTAHNDDPSRSYGASPAIWSHSVTCHPTQVKAPRLNPSLTGRYTRFTHPGGILVLVIYRVGLPVRRHAPIQAQCRNTRYIFRNMLFLTSQCANFQLKRPAFELASVARRSYNWAVFAAHCRLRASKRRCAPSPRVTEQWDGNVDYGRLTKRMFAQYVGTGPRIFS